MRADGPGVELLAVRVFAARLGVLFQVFREPGEEGVLEFRDASAERGMILFDTRDADLTGLGGGTTPEGQAEGGVAAAYGE